MDMQRGGWRWRGAAMGVALALAVAACGGDSEPASPGSASEPEAVTGAKVIDVASMQSPPKGTVNYCTGKDISGAYHAAAKGFDQRFAAQGYKLNIVEFPESADEQRNQFIQRQQAQAADCDIFGADVIWTAEFAAQGWLYDLTPYVESRASEYIPSTLGTTEYQGRNWAVPFGTNAGLFYYRTDHMAEAPTTWQEVYRRAAERDGLVYQGASYEGLTVDFLEVAFAAGGTVLSEDGTKATIDSPENLRALQLMVDGIRDGAVPRAVTTYMEEDARRAYESGDYTFQRNWSYVWVLGNKAPEIKGRFAATPLPGFEDGERAGVLGGNNLVISTYSRNPGLALKAIDWITGQDGQTRAALTGGQPPTLAAVYEDPRVRKTLPLAEQLAEAVANAKARPVSPVYPQISQAIYKNVNAALSGSVSPQEALATAQDDIAQALATF
jgi:multiple sugar transport system substrate-binding protein